MQKDFLRNLTTFTGKHLCQCLFFNKAESKKNLKNKKIEKTNFTLLKLIYFRFKPLETQNQTNVSIFSNRTGERFNLVKNYVQCQRPTLNIRVIDSYS